MKVNVLIPNIGRRGYLVKYLKEMPEFEGKVFVSDSDDTASGLYGDNDGYFILSRPVDNERKYICELMEVCHKEDIRIIIPIIDPEIYILSGYRTEFDNNRILVIVSDRKVLDICYNKLLMNSFLEKHHFKVPKTYRSLESFKDAYLDNKISLPIILKPIYGSGSESTYIIENLEKLEALYSEKMIIQECINGQEFGADVFNNFEGEPLRCVIKKKISMRSGETDKAVTIINSDMTDYLVSLAKKLGHIGNLDLDFIVKDNDIYVIDLNPRFGGGYPATHATGINLLLLVLKLYEQIKVIPEFNNYEDNLLVMKEVNIVVKKYST